MTSFKDTELRADLARASLRNISKEDMNTWNFEEGRFSIKKVSQKRDSARNSAWDVSNDGNTKSKKNLYGWSCKILGKKKEQNTFVNLNLNEYTDE